MEHVFFMSEKPLGRHVEPGLLRVLSAAEEEGRRSPHNVTLRELAALLGRGDAGAHSASPEGAAPSAATTDSRSVLDAK